MPRTNEQLAKHHLLLAQEALRDWYEDPKRRAFETGFIVAAQERLSRVLGYLGVPATANAGDY